MKFLISSCSSLYVVISARKQSAVKLLIIMLYKFDVNLLNDVFRLPISISIPIVARYECVGRWVSLTLAVA